MPVHGALNLPDASVRLVQGFLPERVATALLGELQEATRWSQPYVRLFGKTHAVPRLCCWMGEPTFVYTYSGVRNEPVPWSHAVQEVRLQVERHTGERFDGVLLNLYRDGRDHMGWHADDEPELGPTIASISLGATRTFRLKHRATSATRNLELTNGSLLVMGGSTQEHWVHALPKRLRVHHPRINLTFRQRITGGLRHRPEGSE